MVSRTAKQFRVVHTSASIAGHQISKPDLCNLLSILTRSIPHRLDSFRFRFVSFFNIIVVLLDLFDICFLAVSIVNSIVSDV